MDFVFKDNHNICNKSITRQNPLIYNGKVTLEISNSYDIIFSNL